MRELTVDLFLTVDGWAKGTGSPAFFGFAGPELGAWIEEQLAAPHVMLLGATTYRMFATMDPVDERMAALPTVVFSRSVEAPPTRPRTTVVRGDAAAAVAAMKDGPGDPLRVVGSLSLGCSLLRAGLVDRYRLVVFPQVLGASGVEPAFAGLPDVTLELRASTVLDGRIVVLEYAPTTSG